MNKCGILGCNLEFATAEQAGLHSATSWHCIRCGYSDDREVTIHNIATTCNECATSATKCIRVNFKKKAYVVAGRLSIKEHGRWVHYE
jgi:hypothetical protein